MQLQALNMLHLYRPYTLRPKPWPHVGYTKNCYSDMVICNSLLCEDFTVPGLKVQNVLKLEIVGVRANPRM